IGRPGTSSVVHISPIYLTGVTIHPSPKFDTFASTPSLRSNLTMPDVDEEETGSISGDDDEDQSRPLLGSMQSDGLGKEARRDAKAAEYLGREVGSHDDKVWYGRHALRFLYGNLPAGDISRIAWLSLMLFSIIGGFWLLDSMKDTVLERTVGMEFQPSAKLLSVFVTLLLVIQYNRLIDTCNKPTLFYILGMSYTTIFIVLGLFLKSARFGMGNQEANPFRLVGWVSYVAIETYGSLSVALFWAFTNATVDLEAAKASYGLIIAGAQVGAILGSTAATLVSSRPDLHVWQLYIVGGASPAVMAALVWGYVRLFPDHLPQEQLRQESG
ncbi:unnamed protein product, partial [Choristocarpus tenellus]